MKGHIYEFASTNLTSAAQVNLPSDAGIVLSSIRSGATKRIFINIAVTKVLTPGALDVWLEFRPDATWETKDATYKGWRITQQLMNLSVAQPLVAGNGKINYTATAQLHCFGPIFVEGDNVRLCLKAASGDASNYWTVLTSLTLDES